MYSMNSLKSINKYFVKYKWRLLLGALFVILSTVFSLYQGVIVRKATNEIVDLIRLKKEIDGFIFLKFGLILVALALTSGLFMFLMRQTIIVMSRLIEFDQKNELFQHYQILDAAFYKNNSTGDLMNRISEDVSKVRMYTGPAIMYLINTFATVVIVLVFMIQINWQLTLIVFIPLPFLSFVIYRVSDLINKRSNMVQQELSLLTSHAQESFSAIRIIKSFNRENFYSNKLELLNQNYKSKYLKLSMIEAVFQPVMVLMIGISVIITVWIGGRFVVNGVIEPGNITEFILYVFKLTWPFASLGWVTSLIQRASASQERINDFLNQKSSILNHPNTNNDIKGNIEFKDVCFTYPDSGIQVLKNFNLKIEQGKVIGIKGTIGSGKSTLANLLTRLYDIDSGEIFIDGIPIKDYDVHTLRRSIGYVPQEVFLFSDTIRNNISFSTLNRFSEEEIINASKQAGVYDNIMSFPEKFETVVGERGVTLSGGQKQRVSIARAIISRPKILIFDDCLSAVDVETEELILNHLKDIMKDKTSIIISHRDTAFRDAEVIIDFDKK